MNVGAKSARSTALAIVRGAEPSKAEAIAFDIDPMRLLDDVQWSGNRSCPINES